MLGVSDPDHATVIRMQMNATLWEHTEKFVSGRHCAANVESTRLG